MAQYETMKNSETLKGISAPILMKIASLDVFKNCLKFNRFAN